MRPPHRGVAPLPNKLMGSRRLRVLQAVNSAYCIASQVAPIAQALSRNGIEVDVAYGSEPDVSVDPSDDPLIRHLVMPFSRRLVDPRHLVILTRLRRLIRERAYDVMHFHGPIPGAVGRMAAGRQAYRSLYHCRGTFFPADGSSSTYRARLTGVAYGAVEGYLGRRTHHVFTLNRQDLRDLTSRAGVPADRMSCLGAGGVGIDLGDRWGAALDPERTASARSALGLPDDAFVIGYVGRLVRAKGVMELWRSFLDFARRRDHAHLLLVGNVPAGERDRQTARQLRSEIERSGLANRVRMPGYLPDPLGAMVAMDVMVMASHREGFGVVYSEAGGLGVPVIATRTRGGLEAVLDQRTGLLIDIGSVSGLTSALDQLIEQPLRRADLARQAVAHVKASHHRTVVLRRILDVYETMLGRELQHEWT